MEIKLDCSNLYSLLRQLFPTRQIEYLVLDGNFSILEVSPGAAKFADAPEEAIPGKDIRLAFPELIGLEDLLLQVAEGTQETFSLKGVARSNHIHSSIYLDLSISSFQEQLIILVEEVTEMMLLHQSLVQRTNETGMLLGELTKAKDYINKILVSMGDSLLVTTAEGKIKTVNQAAIDSFGYREQELQDCPIYLIITDPQFNCQEIQQQIIQQEKSWLQMELICTKKNGEKITVEFACSAIQTEVQGFYDIVYIGRDITQRKQAEAEMQKALAKEKELNELKSRFVSIASHEFRNPISSILMTVELLECDANEQGLELLDLIKQSANQLQSLLEDILILGKAEAGKLEFKPVPLNLENFCRKLVAEIESTGTKNKITFVCSPHCEVSWMDEGLLRIIFTNLLSNSIKYSPAGSKIDWELHCNSQEKTARFKVRDRGIGIPPEDLKLLFQSFHRASNVGEIPGTGLGLSIVKEAVDLHGGTIQVESEVGVETIFTVILPLNCFAHDTDDR